MLSAPQPAATCLIHNATCTVAEPLTCVMAVGVGAVEPAPVPPPAA